VIGFNGPIKVIHNFYEPETPSRSREEVRKELGIKDEVMILHSSNLRAVKRIDLLLETVAQIRARQSFKLVILAGSSFEPFVEQARRLGIEDRIVIRENVLEIEEYAQAADIGLYTSESESFCLSILEGMAFGCPSVSTSVGGIPEVIEHEVDGLLVPFGNVDQLARSVERLIQDAGLRRSLGEAARNKARDKFSADAIIPRYEQFYRDSSAVAVSASSGACAD
jgi:glycosyltransferase involved in cell wall biosynthesis